MSLFQPDFLCIGVEPNGVGVVRVAGRRRPAVREAAYEPLAFNPQAPDAIAATLSDIVSRPGFKAAAARVVLADALVRYFVLPRPRGLRGRAELQALVAARFEEQFGLSASDWRIESDLDPRAERYLSCAVPRRLVEVLRDCCARHGMRLLSLEPFAVSEMNRWLGRVSGGSAWFAAIDGGSVTLACRQAGDWLGVRVHAADADPVAQLAALTRRDALLYGMEDQAPVVCTGLVEATTAKGTGPRLLGQEQWPGRGAEWSRRYRLSLSGVWP